MPVITGGFTVTVTPPDGWMLQSVEIGERDVTHGVIDVPSASSYTGRIVLTNRITRLSGMVRGDGCPARATVLVFPDDTALWSYPARHVATVDTREDGTFELRGLPPHDRYLAVALDYLDDAARQDSEVLQRLRTDARAFSLDFGDARAVDLTLGNP